ncbi:membrane protein insertion efficiency factor YidD [Buchnera aphidicola]|uniref:Putative membrane protein insertion efficiency factor n=1 Tax=Buchnera aphidicola (Aphis gossypii) TaxID=98785 RepID=A0A5J6ZD86_9GAMM|nr:membrane protein insertion efficiency factor YidD [Buchnera aphidicola]QFQ31875.1 membrane protein insertion efficiency factor YidD [Buchnera aphidicola (Aphis gossypii)]UPT14407.1 membrane protein insertion efficiency factor YidD [Buchnera aphidicola (Aphis gossypii)]
MVKISSIIVRFLSFFILTYQYCISPFMQSRCRFYPTCSTYMLLSLRKFGFIKGVILTIFRLFKCHPLHSNECNSISLNAKDKSEY